MQPSGSALLGWPLRLALNFSVPRSFQSQSRTLLLTPLIVVEGDLSRLCHDYDLKGDTRLGARSNISAGLLVLYIDQDHNDQSAFLILSESETGGCWLAPADIASGGFKRLRDINHPNDAELIFQHAV